MSNFLSTFYTFLRLVIFIIMCGSAIVVADTFILQGDKLDWQRVAFWSPDRSVDVAQLREQHEFYMEGLDLTNVLKPEERLAQAELRSVTVGLFSNEREPLIDPNPLPKEPAQELVSVNAPQDIEPAVGIDLGDLLEGEAEKKEIIPEIMPDDKTMDDVLSGLEIISPAEEKPNEKLVSYNAPSKGGKIAIIIDDMGLTLRSRQVEVMDGPLTLAYLPYADNLEKSAQRAKNNGHELMLHMPMQAIKDSNDGGPKVLKVEQTKDEFIETLEWGLSSFDGFVGINNHMGSHLTKDQKSMDRLMAHIKDKGLYFIDSKTIGSSVAGETARRYGIPYAERDVFLDHEISDSFVANALKKLEETAARQGYAIAIGHPHKVTVEALKKWIPTLEEKGFELVPASALLNRPSEEPALVSADQL
ncbi:MAG: divergent polysaccharide deacetylase family protein [Alphaproteobacteria bacterium]|nr:divergent polysaccharide deacetylase family protein [Alphaproteobacteria bacterium]